MKTKLQGLILTVGILSAIIAFVTTPKIYNSFGDDTEVCSGDFNFCYADTPTAIARGGSVLLLAAFAFAGVTVMLKED